MDMRENSFMPFEVALSQATKNSTVVIKIENKPILRLIRNVSFSRLDFVVNISGIIGLFFGASILGLVEIIYIWLFRKF